jgi:hypothetical protein
MRRKAVCIGINYPGTDHALAGCVNDATDWSSYLGTLGFTVSTLLDGAATKAAMVAAITDVVTSLRPGDVGAIQYSGHGTWVPDLDGDEPDGKDEALCPADMGDDGHNLLIDDEIRVLFENRPQGSRVVFVTDCCNSGTVFRFVGPFDGVKRRVRFLPPASFVRDPKMLQAVHKLGPEGPRPSDAAITGVVHFAGCRDKEYSFDSEFAGRANGAFTFAALSAVRTLQPDATYRDFYNEIKHRLPSHEYPQSPRFNATRRERVLELFG